MICLTLKPSQNKISQITGVSLWPPSSTDLNPLDYVIRGVLENKTNENSHQRLKTAVEEQWNKMSEELILKSCKSFRRRIDTIIEKNDGHIK